MSDVRLARERIGLSQARAAELLGTSASNISAYEHGHLTPGSSVAARVEALSALAGNSAYATQPLMTAASTAAAIRRAIRRGDDEWPLQLLAQSLADLRRVAGSPRDRALYLAPPRSTGDPHWNTLIAGAVARECALLGVEIPPWTDVEALHHGWSPVPQKGMRRYLVDRTPHELARLGVWLDAGSLESV